MGEIIKSVEVRANSDAIDFFEKHNYKEVLEKYVYVRNRFLELNKLIDGKKISGDCSERDYEDLFYYVQYWYSLAVEKPTRNLIEMVISKIMMANGKKMKTIKTLNYVLTAEP